jgi:hypothetical protein
MIEYKFTYTDYEYLISNILDNNYNFSTYNNYSVKKKPCIIRHDVDFDISKSLQLAKFESEIHNELKSTYFFLISGEFYNIFAKSSLEIVYKILSLGHEIGLHFDETKYPINKNMNLYSKFVEEEIYILNKALGTKINVVSLHRPSKFSLESDLEFHHAINTASREFIRDFKYLSDSRMRWREDVFSIIKDGQFEKLQILTHAFWYNDKEETTQEKIFEFIKNANKERYKNFNNNFSNLNEFVRSEDIQ